MGSEDLGNLAIYGSLLGSFRFLHLPSHTGLGIVPVAGFEPARPFGRGIFLPLRLSPLFADSWSGLCLHPRLYVRVATVKSLHLLLAELGSALPRITTGDSPNLMAFTQ